MSTAILYAANGNQQTVTVNNAISFGNVVRRYGCKVRLEGGNAVVSAPGYYAVDVDIDLIGSATGVVGIQLYKDGVPVPGAKAERTSAAATRYALAIPAVVRHTCCGEGVLTVVLTGQDATITSAAIRVIKL